MSANNDKRIQSIDHIETETYAYGSSKDITCKNGEMGCKNIIKQYKNWLTLMMLQEKTEMIII